MSTATHKPKAKDFYTSSAFHAAMSTWAAQSEPSTHLAVYIFCDDGTGGMEKPFDRIPRATEEVKYKDQDGEVYTTTRNTNKFSDAVYCPEGPATRRGMEAAVKRWLQNAGAGVKKVVFRLEEDG